MFKLMSSEDKGYDPRWPPDPRVIDPDRGYELKSEGRTERGQVQHFSLDREDDGWNIKVRFQDFDQHGVLIPGNLDYRQYKAYMHKHGLRATTTRVLVLSLSKVKIENGERIELFSETAEEINAIFAIAEEAFLVYQHDYGKDADCPVTGIKLAEPGEDEAYGYIEY